MRAVDIIMKKRDGYLCQICLRKQYKTMKQYQSKELEVHHIIPLKEDISMGLEGENLITLCTYHHKMADRGEIPAHLLKEIATEQENQT